MVLTAAELESGFVRANEACKEYEAETAEEILAMPGDHADLTRAIVKAALKEGSLVEDITPDPECFAAFMGGVFAYYYALRARSDDELERLVGGGDE